MRLPSPYPTTGQSINSYCTNPRFGCRKIFLRVLLFKDEDMVAGQYSKRHLYLPAPPPHHRPQPRHTPCDLLQRHINPPHPPFPGPSPARGEYQLHYAPRSQPLPMHASRPVFRMGRHDMIIKGTQDSQLTNRSHSPLATPRLHTRPPWPPITTLPLALVCCLRREARVTYLLGLGG